MPAAVADMRLMAKLKPKTMPNCAKIANIITVWLGIMPLLLTPSAIAAVTSSPMVIQP